MCVSTQYCNLVWLKLFLALVTLIGVSLICVAFESLDKTEEIGRIPIHTAGLEYCCGFFSTLAFLLTLLSLLMQFISRKDFQKRNNCAKCYDVFVLVLGAISCLISGAFLLAFGNLQCTENKAHFAFEKLPEHSQISEVDKSRMKQILRNECFHFVKNDQFLVAGTFQIVSVGLFFLPIFLEKLNFNEKGETCTTSRCSILWMKLFNWLLLVISMGLSTGGVFGKSSRGGLIAERSFNRSDQSYSDYGSYLQQNDPINGKGLDITGAIASVLTWLLHSLSLLVQSISWEDYSKPKSCAKCYDIVALVFGALLALISGALLISFAETSCDDEYTTRNFYDGASGCKSFIKYDLVWSGAVLQFISLFLFIVVIIMVRRMRDETAVSEKQVANIESVDQRKQQQGQQFQPQPNGNLSTGESSQLLDQNAKSADEPNDSESAV